jgi:hypothetical protein
VNSSNAYLFHAQVCEALPKNLTPTLTEAPNGWPILLDREVGDGAQEGLNRPARRSIVATRKSHEGCVSTVNARKAAL